MVAALGFIADLGPLQEWGLEVQKRHVVVDAAMRTNLPRVFAAGDITEYPGKVRLIAVGFGEAATAVNNAAVAIDPSAHVFPGHSSRAADPAVEVKAVHRRASRDRMTAKVDYEPLRFQGLCEALAPQDSSSAPTPPPPGRAGPQIGTVHVLRAALLSYRSKPHCGGQGVYVRHLSRELGLSGITSRCSRASRTPTSTRASG